MKIKPILFSLIIVITILSCDQKKNSHEIDCNYEKKQAHNDFNYKNYTWTIFSGRGHDFLGEKEFIQLLKQNNIKINHIPLSCLSYPNDKYENCREDEMNRLIKQNFGEKFIDSLRQLGKTTFLKNNPDEVFSFEECEQTSRYPATTDYNNQFPKFSKDYFSHYPLPKNYTKKTEDELFSHTSANFILTKTGEIKDLSIKSDFENKKNNIFEKQFNKQLKEFVLHIKWVPAKINDINVDSYMDMSIGYN